MPIPIYQINIDLNIYEITINCNLRGGVQTMPHSDVREVLKVGEMASYKFTSEFLISVVYQFNYRNIGEI